MVLKRRSLAMAELKQLEEGKFQLATDWWAVIAALALALLVKAGAIHRVPW
jgi:hypothetical protein